MKKKMEQFESDMSDTYNIFNELETILYKVGDAPTQPTEDQLMNMLIGVMDLHKVRYEKCGHLGTNFKNKIPKLILRYECDPIIRRIYKRLDYQSKGQILL